MLLRNKIIAATQKLITYRVTHSETSNLSDPLRKSLYKELGEKALESTAMVFFCSGLGTRLAASEEHPKPLTISTPSGKVPLELLIRSVPKEVPLIIISTPPGDKTIQNHLQAHSYYGLPSDSFLFVNQPMSPTNIENKFMPAGTGAVALELINRLQHDSPGLEGIENMIMMDGEKTGFDANELVSFLGFHAAKNNHFTVAAYPLDQKLRGDKKFAHIDTRHHLAYAGNEAPEKLLTSNEDHLLGGGVYILKRDLKLSPIKPALEQKVMMVDNEPLHINFEEFPIVFFIDAAKGRLGYYEVNRGALGTGIKRRDAISANIIEQSNNHKKILEALGWTFFPSSVVEAYNLKLSGTNSDTTLKDGATLFLSGPILIGQANELLGSVSFSADNKQISIGNSNSIQNSTLGGTVTIGNFSELQSVILLADLESEYLDYIPNPDAPFAVNRQRDLIRKINDDINFRPDAESSITIGNRSSIKNCLLVGNVVIGDNVHIKNAIIIGSAKEPTIIHDGTVGENFYSKSSELEIKNITGSRSSFIKSLVKASIVNKTNATNSRIHVNTIYDSTINNSRINDSDGASNYIDKCSLNNVSVVGKTRLRNSILRNKHKLSDNVSRSLPYLNIPFSSSITDSLIADSQFRSTRLQKSTLLHDCHIEDKLINEGATLRFYNSDKQIGVSNLSDSHLILIGFIKKYMLPEKSRFPNENYESVVSTERQILKHLLSPSFEVDDGRFDYSNLLTSSSLPIDKLRIFLVKARILDHSGYILRDYKDRWSGLKKHIEKKILSIDSNPIEVAAITSRIEDSLKSTYDKLFGYRPGLFLIQQAEQVYANIFQSFEDHINYLLGPQNMFSAEAFETEPVRVVMRAFLNLRLNHVIGLPIIDMLTVQEVKQVLHSILNEYMAKAMVSAELRMHHQNKIDDITDRFVLLRNEIVYQHQKNVSLADWLRLAVISNIYDYSTQSVRQFIDEFRSKEALFQLMDKGNLPVDVFSGDALQQLREAGLVVDSSEGEGYVSFVPSFHKDMLNNLDMDEAKRSFIIDLRNLSLSSLAHLQNDERFTEDVNVVIERLLTAPQINYFVDNAGELIFDLELICQILKSRENNKPTVNIISRQLPIENDVDAATLESVITHHFRDLRLLANIKQEHDSTMLGHDIRRFRPSLIDRLITPGSFNLAKGLGNLITMQNVPFELTHVFTSKGVVGRNMMELLRGHKSANVPAIITIQANDGDILKRYAAKFLERKED